MILLCFYILLNVKQLAFKCNEIICYLFRNLLANKILILVFWLLLLISVRTRGFKYSHIVLYICGSKIFHFKICNEKYHSSFRYFSD